MKKQYKYTIIALFIILCLFVITKATNNYLFDKDEWGKWEKCIFTYYDEADKQKEICGMEPISPARIFWIYFTNPIYNIFFNNILGYFVPCGVWAGSIIIVSSFFFIGLLKEKRLKKIKEIYTP
jgi:hypothetical protein